MASSRSVVNLLSRPVSCSIRCSGDADMREMVGTGAWATRYLDTFLEHLRRLGLLPVDAVPDA